MDRSRDSKPGDRRPRKDTRDHRPRYDDRSRSPPPRDRRDDRRRDRSPPRGPPRGPPARSTNDRDGYRDRDYRGSRDSDADRMRKRSPSPPSRRTAAPLQSRDGNAAPGRGRPDIKVEDDTRMAGGVEEFEDEDDEAAMKRMMGFANFRSTKNTKVPGNDKNYAVAKAKPTEYRQYMNREGGFNRALSPGKG